MLGRRQTSRGVAAAAAALALLAAGCSRDGATTGPSGLQSKDFAANLRLVGGDQQVGPIASALAQPIVVRVVDAGGQPVTGATVTFAVRAGGGSVNPAANVSDNNGLVSATWTMGTSLGAAKVVATLTNVFVLDSATFTATATTGPASKFNKVSGDSQTINAGRQLAAPVVVKVQDAFGNNLSGIKVTWTPAALNGTISFVTDTTAADGSASATWKLGTGATVQLLTASITGGTPLTFTATATPDTGRVLTIVSGGGQSAGVSTALTAPVQVKVTDQYGNAVAAVPITWNDSLAGGGTLSATAGQTSALGVASTNWTLGSRAGSQLMRAKLTGRNETVTINATATVAFSDVRAGNFFACGTVASNNNIYCWGAGDNGQLGKGVNKDANSPTVAVPRPGGDTLAGPFVQARQMAGGRNQMCVLTTAQQQLCWGAVLFSAPTNVATQQDLKDGSQQTLFPAYIAMGQDFGCLIELAGYAFCSGQNYSGQLGNGTTASPAPPNYSFVRPAPPSGNLYASITLGRTFACGILRFNPATPATVLASQTPWCWGQNNSGQTARGNGAGGNFGVDSVPAPITTMPAGVGFDSTAISAGAEHACAVESANSATPGQAWCWGNNAYGQLGKGGSPTASSRDSVPRAVTGALVFKRIYAGEFHTCGITTAGGAYCWGRNDYGQLGDGTRTNQSAPVAVQGGLVFRTLSLGELYTCGVVGTDLVPGSPSQTAGVAYCWGDNSRGQLGQGTTGGNQPILTPTRVLNQP
ncbi:MAG: hypothetical protein U9Q74_06220 [Gemmatimonadota bacterium]|nr:hypothetical protein [Gemmatimonadota bacterium]